MINQLHQSTFLAELDENEQYIWMFASRETWTEVNPPRIVLTMPCTYLEEARRERVQRREGGARKCESRRRDLRVRLSCALWPRNSTLFSEITQGRLN